MLHWLARAAKEAREAAGRKQVHIAASISKDQSVIYRFEQAIGWPRDPELIIAGYAEDLDIEPIDLWNRALHLWHEHGQQPKVADLPAAKVAKAFEGAVAAPVPPQRGRGRKRPSRQTGAASG